MNIVEYFVRLHLKRKLNSAEERLAALNELIGHWDSYYTAGKPNNKPAYVVENLAGWKAERASLLVRKANLEKELKREQRTQREV